MIHKDTISGLLLLALAGGYYAMTLNIPSSSLSDEVGADGLPKLLAISLAIVASMITIKGLLMARQKAIPVELDENVPEQAKIPRALGFIALGIGYMVVAPLVGFAAGIATIVIAVALYEREPLSLKLIAVAVAGGIGFWLIFVRFLGTEQPISSLLALLMKS
jgi:putative tricarboxylic transport membrane protein